MRESAIQSKILKWLRANYPEAVTVKMTTERSFAGLPDIMMIYYQTYFFEVKTKKGRLTKLQEHTINKLIKAGAITHVVRSLKEVQEIMNNETHLNK